MIEFRWLERRPVPVDEGQFVLQYRVNKSVEMGVTIFGDQWGEWKQVPICFAEIDERAPQAQAEKP